MSKTDWLPTLSVTGATIGRWGIKREAKHGERRPFHFQPGKWAVLLIAPRLKDLCVCVCLGAFCALSPHPYLFFFRGTRSIFCGAIFLSALYFSQKVESAEIGGPQFSLKKKVTRTILSRKRKRKKIRNANSENDFPRLTNVVISPVSLSTLCFTRPLQFFFRNLCVTSKWN